MVLVSDDDRDLPPRHLGDYPDGAYWSAERPTSPVPEDDLDRRARALIDRLRSELPPRFTVEYQPW